MEYRPLARTGLRVSALGFGAAVLTQDDVDGRRDAQEKVSLALDAGVNFFDTADVYSAGASERLLGHALGSRRDGVLLSSKVRYRNGPNPNDEGLSRAHLLRSAEASLTRLGTDHIDIYHLHEWDGSTPVEETVAALDSLVRAGKIRYAGLSNFSGWQLSTLLSAARDYGVPVVSQQIHYSPVCRDAEYELMPQAMLYGHSIIVWSPLAGGLLGGRHNRTHPDKIAAWQEPPVRDVDAFLQLVDLLSGIAEETSSSIARVVLAWTSSRPGVTTLLMGGRTFEQLHESLTKPLPDLTDSQRSQIDDLTRLPLLYPYWHQLTVADRLSSIDLNLVKPHLTISD